MSEVNIPLLRKAVEWAEAEAAKPFESSRWVQFETIAAASQIQGKSADCGTCFCVAGYIASLFCEVKVFESDCGDYQLDGDGQRAATEVAREHLGLDEATGWELFDANNTIGDVRRIAESIAGESL